MVCGRRSHDGDTQLTNILQCLVVYVDVLVISNAPMEVIEQIGKEFEIKNGEYGLPTMGESNSALEKCVRVSKNYGKNYGKGSNHSGLSPSCRRQPRIERR